MMVWARADRPGVNRSADRSADAWTLHDVGEGQVKRLAGTGPRFPKRVKNAGSARSALLPLYPRKALGAAAAACDQPKSLSEAGV